VKDSAVWDDAGVRSRLRIVRTTAKPVQVKEAASVELPQDASAVWSFMWDPASTVKLFGTTEIAVTLPGSPPGLGEIQAFIERTTNGRVANLHEVVEFEPGRRAVTRSLVSAIPEYTTLTIEPLGPASCRLTQEFWADIPAGVPVATVRPIRDGYRKVLRTLVLRLTELAQHSLT
jgi:hypothetical protein